MRHSHELRRFLARQTDFRDTPTDQETYLRVLCHAEGETVSDPYAVPAAQDRDQARQGSLAPPTRSAQGNHRKTAAEVSAMTYMT